MISTSFEDSPVFNQMNNEEPLPYTDMPSANSINDSPDCLNDLSDDEYSDELYGFTSSDLTILRHTNRIIDLRISSRYRSPHDYNWNPDKPSIYLTKRKRNYPSASAPSHGIIPSVKSTNSSLHSVPKRIRH